MEKDPKSSNKIEELKNKIYSKKQKIKQRGRSDIHETPHSVSSKWKDEEVEKIVKKPSKNLLKSSAFRKLFFGSIAFFLVSVVFGLIMFFGESNTVSGNNIDITVLGNAFAAGGEELPLQIQITNKNNVKLEYSDLLIEYQRGAGLGEDIYRERIGVGDIPAGDIVKELLNVTLFGQQGTTRDIKIALEYRVPGSNAIFIKEKVYTVNISSAPVNLSVSGPENSGSNQNISFSIKAGLNTQEVVKNMMIVAEYPRGFDFKSASPAPTFGDNIWVLGDLNPGVEKEIKVDGVIIAQSGEQRAFNVYVGQQKDVNERDMGVQFNSQSYVVSIQKPLLDTRIVVNGNNNPEVVVTSGSNVRVDIEWKNSTNQKLNDIEVVAEVLGPIVNYSSITTSGFYESSTNKIIWNRQNFESFGSLDPGDDGKLTFSFRTLPPTSGSEANINLSVKARDPNNVNEFLDIKNFDRKVLKIATNLQMAGHALYNSGAFSNTGPLPPSPGQSTTYTITWSLVNSLNDVSGAEVRGKLPIYVEYVGTKSPNSESLVFNQTTKEIVWNVGNIKKGVGTSLPPKEVQFQVRLNPSASQSGSAVDLVESIKYKGLDVSTNTQINNNYPNIDTSLRKDLNYNPQNDKVQQSMENQDLMQKVVSLAKRRGFVFQGSEIYGGLAGTYDYGPLGTLLKNNIKDSWLKKFVHSRTDMYLLDAAILMNQNVWKATGHVDHFSDPMVECLNCKKRFRADQVLKDLGKTGIDGMTLDQFNNKFKSGSDIVCLNCKVKNWGEVRQFNMMLSTKVGASEDSAAVSYLRPETAQGIFVNFKNVVDSMNLKMPFGIAQIGKAFRNEITPRDFIFRLRELEQMEIEYFVKPSDWKKHFEYWKDEIMEWMEEVGLDMKKVHPVEIGDGDRAHYSERTIDFEFEYPFGQKELYGLAYRGDFDLSRHADSSGQKLQYVDQSEGGSEVFVPHVIEPSFGLDRTVLAILVSAYREDNLGDEARSYLSLDPKIAPYKIAVSPLLKNKEDLVEKSKNLFGKLKSEFGNVIFDDNGNIGKRYRRQDEIGTPFCVVVDFESLEDESVTVRFRDTGAQERVKIEELISYFKQKIQ